MTQAPKVAVLPRWQPTSLLRSPHCRGDSSHLRLTTITPPTSADGTLGPRLGPLTYPNAAGVGSPSTTSGRPPPTARLPEPLPYGDQVHPRVARVARVARFVPIAVGAFLALGACSSGADLSVAGIGSTTGRNGFAVTPVKGFASLTSFARESTCEGPGDYSPGLNFVAVPAHTAALALTMIDTDAPGGKVYWIQLLPGDADGIEQHTLTPGAQELTNDFGEATYDGPCPPAGPPHHFVLSLYALPTPLTPPPGADPHTVVAAIRTAATTTASLTVTYTKG